MFGIIVPFQMIILLTLVGFPKLWLFYNSLIIPKITNNNMYLLNKIGWKVINKKIAIEAFVIYIDMNF